MSDDDWVFDGRGNLPRLSWSFWTDAPLTDLRLARETNEVLAADESGGIYLLNPVGQVTALNRLPRPLQKIAFADSGEAAVGITDDRHVVRLTRKLAVQWSRELPDNPIAVAIDPFGGLTAITMADGLNVLFNERNRKHCEFESKRPLRYLSFLGTEPALIGCAEYGFLSRIRIDGRYDWTEPLWSTIGDMTVTGDGTQIYLSAFMHGLQLYGQAGDAAGTLMLEGTPRLLSGSYYPHRLYAATLEKHLVSLDKNGDLRWLLVTPTDALRLAASAQGQQVVCGFKTGQIVCLSE